MARPSVGTFSHRLSKRCQDRSLRRQVPPTIASRAHESAFVALLKHQADRGRLARWSVLVLGLALSACGSGPSTSNSGGWTETTVDSGKYAWNIITCPSANECLLTSSGETSGFLTTDGAKSWNPVKLGEAYPWDVRCLTTTTCYEVSSGGSVLTTNDTGATWRTLYHRQGYALFGISCVTTSNCVAVGISTLIATRDGGVHWSPAQAPRPAGAFHVSCWSARDCVALNNWMYYATHDGGVNWQVQGASVRSLVRVNCPSASGCYAVGVTPADQKTGSPALEFFFLSSDGAKNWSRVKIDGTQNLDGLSCPGPTTCFVSDFHGHVALTEDSGSSWRDRSITTSDGPRVDVIECPTVKVCYAAGRYGRVWVGHFP